MNLNLPLQYKISDWHQLTRCKSNSSRKLSIKVADFLQNRRLSGLRIQIEDDEFGPIFTYVLNATGTLVRSSDSVPFELTPGQLLEELKKYGFCVQYVPTESLPGDQLAYLMTLQSLHYDKLRILNVWNSSTGVKQFKLHIVAFKVSDHPMWLNNGYSPSETEFLQGLLNGSAIDVSAISETQQYSWGWLYGWVANIEDVLRDNAH